MLTEDEVARIIGTEIRDVWKSFSSCYWLGRTASLQLVIQTGDVAPWRNALRQTYVEPVEGIGTEAWAEPGETSVAAFGPGRGAIVHLTGAGISREMAVELLRLALPRL